MTIQDAIEEATTRAEMFKREEISAIAQQDAAHAERCRVAAAVLQEFGRSLELKQLEAAIAGVKR